MGQDRKTEVNPHIYGQLLYDKGGKNIHWKKVPLFNKWYWENWTAPCRRIKLGHCLTPHIKLNSKWIKSLNVRLDTIKLTDEDTGRTLWHKSQQYLFGSSPRVIKIKTKISKWGLVKLKSFCTAKESINKVKKQPLEWEKIFSNEATDKGLIPQIYKQFM